MSKVITKITDIKEILESNNIALYEFEHNINYSDDLASIYYDEFINGGDGYTKQQLGTSSNGAYLIIYGDDVSPDDAHYNKSKLKKLNKAQLIDEAQAFELWHVDDDMTKQEIIDALINCNYSHADYYADRYKRFIHGDLYYSDLAYDLEVAGYSQGDAIKVKFVGDVPDFLKNPDYIQNIYFDAPVTGVIEVYKNGEWFHEIYSYEMLSELNGYTWDKDLFIENMKDAYAGSEFLDALVEWTENNLPTNLNYDY